MRYMVPSGSVPASSLKPACAAAEAGIAITAQSNKTTKYFFMMKPPERVETSKWSDLLSARFLLNFQGKNCISTLRNFPRKCEFTCCCSEINGGSFMRKFKTFYGVLAAACC